MSNKTPNIFKMAMTFIVEVFKFAKTGAEITDRATFAKRWSTCLTCDYFLHKSSRCSQCGCFMKVKAKMNSAKCPKNKW
tara:strand:- start:1742 stop:1978 length:237 start_codon:yes stop_codon:yes gene_type:complete